MTVNYPKADWRISFRQSIDGWIEKANVGRIGKNLEIARQLKSSQLNAFYSIYQAIDDVRISRGACTTIGTEIGTCDFEPKNDCNYKNLNNSDFKWILFNGASPNSFTGDYSACFL